MVGVDRVYFQEGKSDAYLIPYYDDRGTVGDYSEKRVAVISNGPWLDSLESRQERWRGIPDLEFDLRAISDSVTLSIVVPVNQDDPRFGRRNENLHGPMVSKEGLRVIRDEKSFYHPIKER
jgi:hypothetical protein